MASTAFFHNSGYCMCQFGGLGWVFEAAFPCLALKYECTRSSRSVRAATVGNSFLTDQKRITEIPAFFHP